MKLFGTDGIRGKAGVAPLDVRTITRVGAALARAMRVSDPVSTVGNEQHHTARVLVGRDTRESGEWIEAALAAGLVGEGVHVVSAGVVPTPAIAFLTRQGAYDAGIVISASHNPYEDNGIKVFAPSGEKLGEALESTIEQLVHDHSWATAAPHGVPVEQQDLSSAYLRHLHRIVAAAGPLAGARIVLDCANGATAPMAPAFFTALGFDVVAIGVEPSGRNINLGCGSTHLAKLQQAVLASNARLGIAFDGDGDRALFVDHLGRIVDGDAVLLIAAEQLRREGRLTGDAIVATVMSNIGLELALSSRGIGMVRCAVGDKYVMEEMARRRLSLGGEQSGHVIFADHLSTGDGQATALQVLRVMMHTGQELAELADALVTYPQVLVNVRVAKKTDYMQVPAIAELVGRIESQLEGQGRLLIRYSGTEPLLRIMIEGKDGQQIGGWADEIAGAVRAHLGS